eukprot:Platyproteum_vivax@DN3778_c0_g1_i1.p1
MAEQPLPSTSSLIKKKRPQKCHVSMFHSAQESHMELSSLNPIVDFQSRGRRYLTPAKTIGVEHSFIPAHMQPPIRDSSSKRMVDTPYAIYNTVPILPPDSRIIVPEGSEELHTNKRQFNERMAENTFEDIFDGGYPHLRQAPRPARRIEMPSPPPSHPAGITAKAHRGFYNREQFRKPYQPQDAFSPSTPNYAYQSYIPRYQPAGKPSSPLRDSCYNEDFQSSNPPYSTPSPVYTLQSPNMQAPHMQSPHFLTPPSDGQTVTFGDNSAEREQRVADGNCQTDITFNTWKNIRQEGAGLPCDRYNRSTIVPARLGSR